MQHENEFYAYILGALLHDKFTVRMRNGKGFNS